MSYEIIWRDDIVFVFIFVVGKYDKSNGIIYEFESWVEFVKKNDGWFL